MMSESLYQILGIPRDADEREIKRAYHRLARELHPDKAESPEKAREVEQRFAVVSTAYNVLKDLTQRAEYDRKTFGSPAQNGLAATPPAPRPGTPTAAALSASRPAAATATAPAASHSKDNRQKSYEHGLTPERVAIAQKAFVKGCQLMKENDFAKAVEFFEAAISNNETEAVYHARLGHALIEAKKSASRAIEAAQAAIDLDKYNLDFKFNLAHIYETIGSKTNAIKVYEEIVRWDTENQMALQMLRTLTKKTGFFNNLSDSSRGLFSSLRKKS